MPSMVYLFGLSQHRAHGTSLAYMSPVALLAALFYSHHGSVDWTVAVELAVGGVIGAVFGARLCALLSSKRLRLCFGLFLAIIGIRMLWEAKAAFAATAAVSPIVLGHALPPDHLLGAIAVLLIGVITGMFSGMLGIGGGIIMIPTLVLLFGFTQRMAQGISLAVIIPVSISGTLIHNKHENVNWTVAGWLILGGMTGGFIGARLANIDLGNSVLSGLFGFVMLTTGVLMARRKTEACN